MTQDEMKEVSLDLIVTSPFQPRRLFSREELEELAGSIQEIGLIHPPLVREIGENAYELIAGERRLRAFALLGKKKIPVVVRSSSDASAAQSALIENVQRVDLNPLEVARALKALMIRLHLTQEELADKVGKKRSTVANYLRLLQLPEEVQEALRQDKITMGHAKAILSLKEPLQRDLCHFIIEKGLSVRQAESKASQWLEKKPPKEKGDLFLKEIEKKLEGVLGTRVELTKNKIVIDYYNFDDLDRILECFHAAD